MKRISWKVFLKNYIGLVMIMTLIYFITDLSGGTSLLFVAILGLPITLIMHFTGWDEKLKKHLP